jgi:hypothetical protein
MEAAISKLMNKQKLYFVTIVHKILSSEHNFCLFIVKDAYFPSVAEIIITFVSDCFKKVPRG